MLDKLPKDTLKWKIKLIKQAASYANSHIESVTAEVLLLARFVALLGTRFSTSIFILSCRFLSNDKFKLLHDLAVFLVWMRIFLSDFDQLIYGIMIHDSCSFVWLHSAAPTGYFRANLKPTGYRTKYLNPKSSSLRSMGTTYCWWVIADFIRLQYILCTERNKWYTSKG